jgi:hypothetical protein
VQTAKTGGKKKQVESELFYHVGPTCPWAMPSRFLSKFLSPLVVLQ